MYLHGGGLPVNKGRIYLCFGNGIKLQILQIWILCE